MWLSIATEIVTAYFDLLEAGESVADPPNIFVIAGSNTIRDVWMSVKEGMEEPWLVHCVDFATADQIVRSVTITFWKVPHFLAVGAAAESIMFKDVEKCFQSSEAPRSSMPRVADRIETLMDARAIISQGTVQMPMKNS